MQNQNKVLEIKLEKPDKKGWKEQWETEVSKYYVDQRQVRFG